MSCCCLLLWAPSQGWATYDERVDIFSLGIVVFELWYPFKTGMERAEKLRLLRELGTLPHGFAEARPQVASGLLRTSRSLRVVKTSMGNLWPERGRWRH